MFLIDSHCHLDSLNLSTRSIDKVLQDALKNDVKHCLSVATTLSGYESMRQLLTPYQKQCSLSCGIHPLNLDDEQYDANRFETLARQDNVVALGETGLDYYYQQDNIELQQTIFKEHIRLGRKLSKPIIVHTRSSKQDTLKILKEEHVHSGVLHCFTEDIDTAKQLLDIGFYISFSGIITFKNAEALREVAKYVPIDRILVETDSPYLAPVPYRGKENQPAYVREVANYLSILKGVTLDIIAQQTTNNFCQLFNLQGKLNE
ncbi:metal-dependent hydrolase [Gilliamella sp. Choc4-2]|uniref:YchF/TatD family DNA exonuclease n=1 Tax=unclassified Gilliamella TaxID=2685620 RepID=UPI0004DD4708|nr:YchF/TatD family DNA exonuclease [Gilliamella apicola]KFA58663.1 putative deoxyribonuclease YcfH [Gilliamella apicola]OCG33142.1 metal-dependent hydrolase [Gilliamella apicola]OCG46098.1 metal-dependent hydrolase [Gilliamella apicola]OCG54870.1 metal-dependent hydrolase [Gilliamella apicola]OCG62308.1 metal-dependent hydrolase [Gilliamella apicola]